MDLSYLMMKHVKKEGLINEGDRLILGVSGGADSVVLLDIVSRLLDDLGLEIIIVHVNYGLRGKESNRDEKFVSNLAKKYGFKCIISKGMKAGKENLQNTARKFRYELFLSTAKKFRAKKIATAHHADDQAETVLLHLVRGTGLQGLAGMTPQRELVKGVTLVRPLLDFTKADILKYIKERGLKFVEDSTNKTEKYSRNVIRNKVLPQLKKLNEGVINSISKTASILAEEERYLNEVAASALKKASDAFRGDPSYIALKRPMLMKYDVAIMRRVLRLAYSKLTGGTADLLVDHIDKMILIISSTAKEGRYSLPRGIKFLRKNNTLTFQK